MCRISQGSPESGLLGCRADVVGNGARIAQEVWGPEPGQGLHPTDTLTQAQLLGLLGSLFFLGQALTAMLVYVWSRRSPQVRVNFFGLLTFQAPFLPWALMGFSMLLGNSILVDLLGESLPARPAPCGLPSLPRPIPLWGLLPAAEVGPGSLSPAGIAVGHIYYFLEDVFPNQPGGKRLLLTPGFL